MSALVLSHREIEVLRLVQQGLPNKLIADGLSISEGTVKIHLHNMFKKLSCRNRAQMVYVTTLPGTVILPSSWHPGQHRTRRRPRPSTKTGFMYDMFKSSPGIPIEGVMRQFFPGESRSNISQRVSRLRKVYGLDIRRLPGRRWCLVGEWVEGIYMDHTKPQGGSGSGLHAPR